MQVALWLPPKSEFTGFRFPAEAIVVAVRWYLRFSLSVDPPMQQRLPRPTGWRPVGVEERPGRARGPIWLACGTPGYGFRICSAICSTSSIA
jgi:hypothetical protein